MKIDGIWIECPLPSSAIIMIPASLILSSIIAILYPAFSAFLALSTKWQLVDGLPSGPPL